MPQGEPLHVLFTMDVLPAGASGEVRGPDRWDDAGRSLGAFADALAGEGCPGTFFVAPEVLNRLRRPVQEARAAGHELGLLCHPQLAGYQACLGSYGFDRQREIVGLQRKVWEQALGEPPVTFRAGFFSANDYTFHVLCLEGFRQGSCSLPGRVDNDQCSLWFPAYPFPHHTDPLDRTSPGTMEFYEAPVASDFQAATSISYETYTPPYLRIEQPDIHEYACDLVEGQLDRMAEEGVQVRALTLITSNVVGWGRSEDPHVERLQNLCAMLREAAGERGMELRPVTLAQLHAHADEALRSMRELDEI